MGESARRSIRFERESPVASLGAERKHRRVLFHLAVASLRNLVLFREGLLRGSANEMLRSLYVKISQLRRVGMFGAAPRCSDEKLEDGLLPNTP